MGPLAWIVGGVLLFGAVLSGAVSGMCHCESAYREKAICLALAIVLTVLGALLWRAA